MPHRLFRILDGWVLSHTPPPMPLLDADTVVQALTTEEKERLLERIENVENTIRMYSQRARLRRRSFG